MKSVLITTPAKNDIIQIKDYINNSFAYKKFINTLSEVFDMLLEFPNAGVQNLLLKIKQF